MGLKGLVQNRPDGQVLVIAEGEKQTLERFAAALQIKNAFIEVLNISLEYSPGSGGFSDFRKITGPDEVGERLDDLKTHMDMRFERIEADLAELKEIKTALKERGII